VGWLWVRRTGLVRYTRSMKKIAAVAVVLSFAALILAGSAEAREKKDKEYYVSLYGLYAFESLDEGQTKDKFSGPIKVDFDDAWGFQVRGGYIMNKYFSAEAMFEYVAPFEAKSGANEDDLDVMNFTLNGKFTCPAYEKFVPYAVVGLGAMNAYEDISYGGRSSETSDWGFGARCGLGLDLYIDPDFSLGLEGVYVFGTGDVDHVEYTSVALGASYHF
ncbi:MAG: porin family protein, partial [Desulfobacterales bacterium]|nr:porin family protein [Desulfobacterales bacterium]